MWPTKEEHHFRAKFSDPGWSRASEQFFLEAWHSFAANEWLDVGPVPIPSHPLRSSNLHWSGSGLAHVRERMASRLLCFAFWVLRPGI